MANTKQFRQSVLDLAPGTRYAIRIRAVNGFGVKSVWSEALEFNTNYGGLTPATPTNIAYRFDNQSLFVSWDPVTINNDGSTFADLLNYEFHIVTSTNPDGTYESIKYLITDNNFKYTLEQNKADHGGVADISVDFVIRTAARSGKKSGFSELTQTVHGIPTTPTAPILDEISGKIIVGMAVAFEGFDYANLFYSTNATTYTAVPTASIRASSYTFSPPSTNTTYYFKYKVADVYGQVSAFSAVSSLLISVSGGAPTGVAGGDLQGTYPNPTIKDGSISLSNLDFNLAYTHTQTTPSSVWTINHNLGFRPNIQIVDSFGDEVFASMTRSTTQVVITLSIPVAGIAYLS